MKMAGEPVDPDDDARMLDASVGIEEFRTHGADVGPAGKDQQAFQPRRLDNFDVIVEKHEKWRARFCRGAVAQLRIVERAGQRQDTAVSFFRELREIGFGPRLDTAVVDNEDLDAFRARMRCHAFDAGLQKVQPIARRDNDRR